MVAPVINPSFPIRVVDENGIDRIFTDLEGSSLNAWLRLEDGSVQLSTASAGVRQNVLQPFGGAVAVDPFTL